MKKIVTVGIICVLCGTAFVFADDASVLPARVGRVYLAPAFAFANGGYDTSGDYKSYRSGEGAMKAFAMGVAAEYGVLDWISAAVQWTPAWVLVSDVDTRQSLGPVTMDDVNANGPADIFIGGKFLLIGEKAPAKSSQVRFAVATGVKVPIPGPDYREQFTNALTGQSVTGANQDKHVLGLGLRTYADYIVNKNFFIDFYTEFIGYPMKGKLSENGLQGYLMVQQLEQAKASLPIPGLITYENEVRYGYDLTLELESVFTMPLAQSINFTAGLPLNLHFSPPEKYTINFHPLTGQRAPEDESSLLLSLRPNISFFFTGFVLPTEFKLSYWAPIAGNNNMATHTVSLQIKLYFKI
jgi:hypothetical protein